jgi:hypothetical protein
VTTRERRDWLDGRVLRIDLDRPRLPARLFQQLVGTLRWLRIRPDLCVLERTARGWHLKVRLTRRLPPTTVIALQAILGSDRNRETFNLRRARALRRVPVEQRDRYSIFFRRKLERSLTHASASHRNP